MLMNTYKITVIIPVHNGYKYINRCIESILNQDVTGLDIIVIDDGSTDGSGGLLDEWAIKDDRIHVLHTNNQGVSAARNVGIKHAAGITGEGYIHFVDIDDELYPDCYKSLSKKLCKLNIKPDIIIFGYTTNYVNEEGASIRKGATAPKNECLICGDDIKNKYFEYYGIRKGLRNPVWNKLFKTSICKEGVFDQSLKQAEDLFFNIDVLGMSRSIYLDNNIYYQYNKSIAEKAYYDSDVQMAYDRNKQICDRIINFGINQEESEEEYYHKVIDTAYDYCMLQLRTEQKNKILQINDALQKLKKLGLPSNIKHLTLQQKVVLLAMKFDNKYSQYFILELVRRIISILK